MKDKSSEAMELLVKYLRPDACLDKILFPNKCLFRNKIVKDKVYEIEMNSRILNVNYEGDELEIERLPEIQIVS
jgi:hypothetical protein